MNLFGTDGVRGKANEGYITPDNIVKLAISVVSHYKTDRSGRFCVVIGKDTRLSCYMLESALTAGFISAGADVVLLGPIPTPAVAALTKSLRADIGVVVSASHNQFEDNGIKFFDSYGFKISPNVEKKISDIFFSGEGISLASPSEMGKAKRLDDADGRYIEFVKSSFPRNLNLAGMKIVVDTANGAAYKIASQIFWELGAQVIAIGNEPNGININDGCGATNTTLLRNKVLENEADIGFALDGDADRLIVIDSDGTFVDGDYIIAAIATDWKRRSKLTSNAIVTTTMSNLGFEKYINTLGLSLIRTDVGDKFVVEKMREIGANLGGEKSGHIIPLSFASTGDGLISALQILTFLIRNNMKSNKIKELFTQCPYTIKNINRNIDLHSFEVQHIFDDIKKTIPSEKGRIVVRKSGTENIIRIMVEAEDENLMNLAVSKIEAAF